MATKELPLGIDYVRHHERSHHSPLPRRIGIALLTLACLLGLLNVFGQRTSISRADTAAASLTVDSPEHMRGGVIFTTQITVMAHHKLNDAQLKLSGDWFRGMTFNGIAPQASNESSSSDGVTFDYGQLEAGETLPIWISWQVNPTNVGFKQDEAVLSDGDNQLVSVKRQRWIFP